jgi:hypothetical protein
MKTLKQLALASAVLAVPFMAQAELKSMDDSALATVTGQDGISISGSFNGTIGSLVYKDNDVDGGSLRMETVGFNGFNISDADPLKVDVVTNGSGTQQLQITLPSITGQLSVGAIKVGDTSAKSIGSLAINDMNMANTKINIWGH